MERQSVYNPVQEKIVEVICARTSNTDKGFFRPVTAYFLAKIASNMRCSIHTKDMGTIPVNCYSICLSPSGYGKNHSINIIEDEFLSLFKDAFMYSVLPSSTEQSITEKAEQFASVSGAPLDAIVEKLNNSCNNGGEFLFSFDSGTIPAIKQMRNKLILSGAGAISMEVDEIGSNLDSSNDILPLFLEMYDLGKAKQKLIKNTSDAVRDKEISGRVPANMLMFGTPSKVFDGDKTENTFIQLLETGYARRCLFGYGVKSKGEDYFKQKPEDIYRSRVNSVSISGVNELKEYFASLANLDYLNRVIEVPDEVAIELTRYRLECEHKAENFHETDFIRKAELEHRYFKTLKLAGVYAFIDGARSMTMEHLFQAITLVEECGNNFEKIINQDPDFVRLAKYIGETDRKLTNADLVKTFSWYKTLTKRKEAMTMARAWGYSNNILINQETKDGIEFFSANKLVETDLDNLIISISKSYSDNYQHGRIKFSNICKNCNTDLFDNQHFCNHYFENDHRKGENLIEGFNMIVLDLDGTISIDNFKDIMKPYTWLLHTTKRHTNDVNRFRVIIPIKYELQLDKERYKKFMMNILKWLPFTVDDHSACPEQAWTFYKGSNVIVNEGDLFDPLPFIPNTARNDSLNEQTDKLKKLKLDKVEQWFYSQLKEGNRNNMLFRFGMMLIDSGMEIGQVKAKIKKLNESIDLPLTDEELERTIFNSLDEKYEVF